jgi:hypothetical protein
MKTITIGFSKSSKSFAPFSFLIRWAQGTEYSHAYLRYPCAWSPRNIYFQASHTTVNFMSEKRFLAEETVIQEFEFQIDDEKFNKMQDFCIDRSSEPYGTLAAFGMALAIIAKKFGFKAKNPIRQAAKSPVCSQLIAALIEDIAGIDLNVEDMTPKDLFPIVESLPRDLNSTQTPS